MMIFTQRLNRFAYKFMMAILIYCLIISSIITLPSYLFYRWTLLLEEEHLRKKRFADNFRRSQR